MKRYGSLLILIVIAFTTLASNISPENALPSLHLIGTATRTPTKRPTATKIPKFKPTPKPAPSDVNSVIKEVLYFGLGGGDGDAEDHCKKITKPTIVSEWTDIEQLHRVWAFSCGWKVKKKVSAIISRPDGTTWTETIGEPYAWPDTASFGHIYWDYVPTAFDQIGTYQVDFSNGEESQHFEFHVSNITIPGAILIYDDQEIQIYRFRPHERVRLFRYELYNDQSDPYNPATDQLNLLDWQEFTTGSDGKLRIALDSSVMNDWFAAIGEKTGEFHLTEGFGQSILKASNPVVSNKSLCSGAPKSKVAVGSTARVTFTNGTPTRIRKQPTTSGKILGRIPEGTRFLIVGGHTCSDGYTWWNIELANGTRGWMAEGKDNSYYLEPMNFLQQSCSGFFSFLEVGSEARVAKVDGSNMRIRSQPGFSQDIVAKVPEGTRLTILNGPRCIDGAKWWYIRTKGGIEGWMTESQNNIPLLEPASS